jgi:hypothetical protein
MAALIILLRLIAFISLHVCLNCKWMSRDHLLLMWIGGKRHCDAGITLKLPAAGAQRDIADKLLLYWSHCIYCI